MKTLSFWFEGGEADSKVELITKTPEALTGVRYQIEGSKETAFEEIGADIIRYNFVSTPLINDVKFGRDTCDEVKRKLLGLWNAYIFFMLVSG